MWPPIGCRAGGNPYLMDAQTRALQVGAGTRGSLNKIGQDVCSADRCSSSKGCRAHGAGRKDHLVAYKKMMKEWVEVERANGHSLDMTDLRLQWTWFADETRKGMEARMQELQPHEKFPGSSIGTSWGKS